MEPREARCGPNAGHSSGRPGAPSRCELAPLSRTGIFVIDMVVSSLLMYRVPASRKVEKPSSDGKEKKVALTWEFRYGFVLHNYLTGWFLIDLLSVTERLTLTVTVTVTVTVTLTLTQVGPSAFDIYDLATPPAAVANATASLLELGRGDLIGSPNATALLDEVRVRVRVRVRVSVSVRVRVS